MFKCMFSGNMKRKVIVLILVIALFGLAGSYYVDHFQGGEIYEASNSFSMVEEGFNVNLTVETVDGEVIDGELYFKDGSTLGIISNGERISIGGSLAEKEDKKAEKIEVDVKGKVYEYKVPKDSGKLEEIIAKMSSDSYSQRFSGTIYIENSTNIGVLGSLKYEVDELHFGEVGIEDISPDGAVLSLKMVPLNVLKENIGQKSVLLHGDLYVNSEERTLNYEILEVRTP